MNRFFARSFAAAAAAALLGAAGVARAATATWNASDDRTFSNSNNWTFSPACGGCVPGQNDDVRLDGNTTNTRINVDVSIDVKSITAVSGYSGNVNWTGPGTGTMRVRGDVNLSGGTGNFDFAEGTTQIDGNVTVPAVTIAGNGGDLTINGNLSLSGSTVNGLTGSLTVGGSITLTNNADFNGSSGPIIMGGSLNLASGSFKASGGTTRIGGAFNDTGGTYSDNGGLLLFNSKTNQTHTFGGSVFKKATFNDGMVGYWNLDEGSGTTVNDLSGYINTGTSTNMTRGTTSGPGLSFGNTSYGTFNGTSSRVSLTVAQMPAANAAQSISAWININGLPASASSIVSLAGSSSAVRLGISPTQVQVLRNNGTAMISTAVPSTGSWHHVAYTWDGSSNNLYVDGVAATATATAHDSAAVTSAFLGATSAAAGFFNGSIDEVRLYDRALTALEVSSLALGRTPGTSIATHTFSDAYVATVGANVADLVIASGTVSGPGAISIEGSWLNYGGRFTGTGTVTLQSAGTESVLSGGSSFAALVINRNGDNYNLVDRLWIPNGSFTLMNGRISLNSYTMHVGSMTLVGDTFTVGTGTVVIDGTSNVTLPSSVLTAYNALRLEDPTETGLVGYWKLDEGSGPSTRDWSGSLNTGALSSGARWTSPSSSIGFDDATAVSFNGSSGYVSVGTTSLPAANAAQTISAWVNITALPGSASSIVALTGASSAVKLGLSATQLRVLRNDGTALISTAAPSTGAWHHVAYTWNGSSANNLYVDGVAATPTATTHDSAGVTGAFIGATSAAADFFNGKVDDVRVYNVALTAAQVAQLAAGRYAGTGGYPTYSLGANTTVAATFAIDAANLSSGSFTFNHSLTTATAQLNAGTYTVGSAAQQFQGGLAVQPGGTLAMATSGGSVQIASGKTLTMDGALNASSTSATIRSVSGTYNFSVGSTSSARPTLNITGLAVQNTGSNGMQVNVDHGAITTFTRFDNIVFTAGTGTFLNIYATALYLSSSGARFGITTGGTSDFTLPTNNVTLTGNGTADGDTRIVFGSATCAAAKTTAGYCQHAWAVDDDPDGNGVGNTPATNGSVVQYVRSVSTDTAGSIEGFPTAAFDFNTFAYYSTYVAYHDTSGTVDTIYVRDQSGTAKYQWNSPSGETIVGTPRWTTTSGSHYLFVTLASGKVYRLVDTGAALALDTSTNWAGKNPFDCGCTIVTPLSMDANNVYWGGTTGGTQALWTLGQVSRAQPTGSPFAITPVITSATPTIWIVGNVTYMYFGVTGNILKFNTGTQTLEATNSNPGSASIRGRVAAFGNFVFAGDDAGTMWAVDQRNFAGTNKLWSYPIAGDSIWSSPFYDSTNATLHFGTDGGKVVAISSAGVVRTGYPYVPGTTSDAFRSALLYVNGVLAAGSTTGKLFFIDRNNGTTGPALIRQYSFGPTESVSGVAFDSNSSRFMVSTADPTTNDGRLYYIDAITDPTSSSL
ncbi:MAG TPA: LamG-like jellyroll fold domain-containing protein [Polyangia bacterium]